MPLGPDARLRDAIAENVTVTAQCPQAHDYIVNLPALVALAGPYAHLDRMLATSSWCPDCGALPVRLDIARPATPPASS